MNENKSNIKASGKTTKNTAPVKNITLKMNPHTRELSAKARSVAMVLKLG